MAAQFYGMIAEYNAADTLAKKGLEYCADGMGTFMFSDPEKMSIALEKQKADTLRYRTKRPYWPATEERRRAVAMFYDKRTFSIPALKPDQQRLLKVHLRLFGSALMMS
ncbi:hypothetical protein SDC9_62694 [bioreactor metagenome]|uniref:Uncharacterized protein n=1 Tax=bioreactor metagenome TaxID=1076179 RepID=A0A644XJE3_9ZZZZ